jgi:sodium-dependent dicarboxylate transporter 2/3/5
MRQPPSHGLQERRYRTVLRSVFAYLNLERHEEAALPARPTAFVGVKLAWTVVGLLGAAWVLWGGAFPAMPPQARSMAALAVLMAVWWLTEALPISVTALAPLVALPLLGIANARAAAAPYADPNVFLFVGGFILAACMQRWGLHRRLALAVLLALGGSPRRIVLGCMVATAFLSMWASNTATVLMMLPIATALIDRGGSEDERERQRFATCLLLGIAYAASAGGMGTLIGTPPNIVFAAVLRRLVPGAPEVSFLRWMGIGVPVALALLVLTYVLLTRVLFQLSPGAFTLDMARLREERQAMGPMSPGERYIAAAFLATALLWIFRRDLELGTLVIPGWSRLLAHGESIHDGTVAIAMAVLLFAVPVDRRQGLFLMDRDWYKAVPWDIVMLFGGGFALANGFQSSGLSAWMGERLVFVGALPPLAMMLAVALFTTLLTQLTSNTATTTVLLPILAATALAAGASPVLYMLPATFAASAAFMLPVATPPNAIVFASGRITVAQMARAGVLLNLLSVPVIALLCWWLGPRVLGM